MGDTIEALARQAHQAVAALVNGLGESGMLRDDYLDTPGAVDVSEVIRAESELAEFEHALARRDD